MKLSIHSRPFAPTPSAALPLLFSFLAAPLVHGQVAPYSADAHTLHLWHFDEADPGPVAPADGISGSFELVPDGGSAGTPATLGAPGFAGFGSAGDTTAGSGAGFRGESVPITELTGPDGAFTFEALIRIANNTDRQMIISGEGNPLSERPFQFRVANGEITLINIAAGGSDPIFPIPDSGPDAYVPDEWFHVAAVYNGDETSTEDNFKMYWTRVDATRSTANEIGSTVMDADLSGQTAAFGVANDYRTVGTGNSSPLTGQVDEVRISDIARDPDDMIFGNQGAAAGPQITAIAYSPDANSLSLTWRKSTAALYKITYSSDLSDWSASLGTGVTEEDDENPGDADTLTVTFVLDAIPPLDRDRLFFRVEEAG